MSSTVGRIVVETYTNQSGGSVANGDLVYVDTGHTRSFITGTTGAYTGMVGVCIEPNGIANGATGRIQTQGEAALITVNASVTLGHFAKSYTVAKQATDAGASRVVGAFGQFTTGGTTPTILLFGFPDSASSSAAAGTPAVTLSTTAAAGAAATFVATDATIIAFDATVPAADGTAAAGSAAVAARRDHVHPAFVVSENYLGSNTNMTTANTYYDGPSLTIGPGRFLLDAVISLDGPNAGWFTAKIWNGTTQYSGSPAEYNSTAGGGIAMTVIGYVDLSGSTTVKVSATGSVNSCHILTTDPTGNGTANKASYLRATKIADH